MSIGGRHLVFSNNTAFLVGTRMGGKRSVVFCETFFRFVVKSRMCCLSYYVYSQIILCLSHSLSSRSRSSADTNAEDAKTHNLTRFFSLSLSFKVLFLFRFSFVIDTKTRDSFKQQRSVAHRIWTLLELDACTVRLL